MEGKTYQARDGRVRMDEAGLDVYSRRYGGIRLPWPVIAGIETGTAGRSGTWQVLVVHLVNGESLTLPAPISRTRDADLFHAQAREIIEAYEARGAGLRVSASGEPQDGIPVEYRVAAVGQIEYYRGPSRLFALVRPSRIVLLALVVAGAIGLGGSIHSYLRDLPTYDTYRAAAPCQAVFAAEGSSGPAYCTVTDGVVEQSMTQPSTGLYELAVGPSEPSLSLDGVGYTGPEQYAFFVSDQPALDALGAGEPADYVAANGGDVVSVTVNGVTYQTIDSPAAQDVFDWASIFAAASLTLLFAVLLVLKVARRRLLGPWGLPPLVFVLAFVTNAVVAGDQSKSRPPGSVLSLLGLTGLVVVAGSVLALAPVGWMLRRRARPLVSRRCRALP